MNKLKHILSAAIAVVFTTTSFAQNYEIDVEQSILNWTGYAEVGGYSQSGTLNFSSGTMVLNEGELSGLNTRVDMRSLKHEEKDLETHLKQKDFFYVKKYPEATLIFVGKENEDFLFDLTIRGITQTIVLPVNIEMTNSGCTASGKVTIDRTRFDIKYNSSSYFQDLGSYAIKNEFDLEYILVFKTK